MGRQRRGCLVGYFRDANLPACLPAMTLPPLTIVQMNPEGSLPVPSAPAVDAAAEAAQMQLRMEELQSKLDALQELLDKPISAILAEQAQAQQASAAWDAFGAMWMLSQRAMRRVAMDLAAAQGLSEEDVVQRALAHARNVLNVDGEDLGGSIAEAQLAHIARHRPFLRKQFR